MRALTYEKHGGIEVMQLGEIPKPTLADDEILVRVQAASINPFDWKLRSGSLREFFRVDFPITPGRDGCGEVVAFGKTVANENSGALSLGQRISFISSRMQKGSLAEYAAVKAKNFVAPTPENLSDQQGAALPFVGLSAWNALVDTAELKPGMRVLIHGGSGGIGSLAIQLARHLGAEIYATCSSRNADFVEELGATAIAYDRTDFTKTVTACDVVLDTIGGETHEKSYSVLKPGGKLVYFVAQPFADLSNKFEVDVRQVIIQTHSEKLSQVMGLAAQGILRPKISPALPLTEFKNAFQMAESGRADGRIVMNINGPNNEPAKR